MDPDGKRTSTRAALLAAAGQNRWPPAGSYMAATGQDLMAADSVATITSADLTAGNQHRGLNPQNPPRRETLPANASNAPLLATSRGHDRLRPPPAGVVGGRGGAVRDAAGAVGGSDRADGVMLRGVGPQTRHGPRRGRQVARDR